MFCSKTLRVYPAYRTPPVEVSLLGSIAEELARRDAEEARRRTPRERHRVMAASGVPTGSKEALQIPATVLRKLTDRVADGQQVPQFSGVVSTRPQTGTPSRRRDRSDEMGGGDVLPLSRFGSHERQTRRFIDLRRQLHPAPPGPTHYFRLSRLAVRIGDIHIGDRGMFVVTPPHRLRRFASS